MPVFTIFLLLFWIKFWIYYLGYLIDFKYIKRIVIIINVYWTNQRYPPFPNIVCTIQESLRYDLYSSRLLLLELSSLLSIFYLYYYCQSSLFLLFFSPLNLILIFILAKWSISHLILFQSVSIRAYLIYSMSTLHLELIYSLPLESDSLIWNS